MVVLVSFIYFFLFNKECCRSQAVQLNVRPMVPGAHIPAPPPSTSHDTPKATHKPVHKLKPADKTAHAKDGSLCLRKCQNLCDRKCRFECCLQSRKHFDDDPKPKPHVVKHHDKSPKASTTKNDKKEEDTQRESDTHYIRPVASPQAVPFPRIGATPSASTSDPCAGQDPCTGPTTSPFGSMTDPFGSSTPGYGMTQNPYYATSPYAQQTPPTPRK